MRKELEELIRILLQEETKKEALKEIFKEGCWRNFLRRLPLWKEKLTVRATVMWLMCSKTSEEALTSIQALYRNLLR